MCRYTLISNITNNSLLWCLSWLTDAVKPLWLWPVCLQNAMALCNGQSPEFLHYDTKSMRQHLAGCLDDQVFRYFPARKRKKQRNQKSVIKVTLYCSCRLPEGGERMIAFDKCGEWYHKNCFNGIINIPSSVWMDSSYKWTCHICIMCTFIFPQHASYF